MCSNEAVRGSTANHRS